MRRFRPVAPLLLALLTWQAEWGASVAACQMPTAAPGHHLTAPPAPSADGPDTAATHDSAAHTPALHHPASHHGHADDPGSQEPASHDPASHGPVAPCPLPGGCAAPGALTLPAAAHEAETVAAGTAVPHEPHRAPSHPGRAPEPPPPRPLAHP